MLNDNDSSIMKRPKHFTHFQSCYFSFF